MREILVEHLACPACYGNIEIIERSEENAIRILQGTLRCTVCDRRFPIKKGVPRLLVDVPEDVAEIGKRFSFQWLSRWRGLFEGKHCYGFKDDLLIGWVNEQLQKCRMPKNGEWMLDAGCGSGEKTAVLAKLCPEQNVVGMDLGVEPQEEAIAKFGQMPNLDYVQGNVLQPPFKSQQFAAGMSIGVLHHTPKTREAFSSFRSLFKKDTAMMLWLYPTYSEGPEWRLPYFVRDFILLGQGYRIPTRLLRFVSYIIVCTLYPIGQLALKKSYRRMGKDLPFFQVDKMTLSEQFKAMVFWCVDTIHPRYQWRHSIKEVENWFIEEGLKPALHKHGFYLGCSAADDSNPASI